MADLKNVAKINRRRPTIGVTGPDKGGEAAWLFTALSVWLAGGKPVRITPQHPRTSDGLQGLIIGGGADVDPTIYEQDHVLDEYLNRTLKNPRKNIFKRIGKFIRWVYYPALFLFRKLLSNNQPLSFGLDRDRDHLELVLLDQAVRKDLPVMGICRGSQLLNVYFKGTLYKNLDTFYVEEPNPASLFPVKKVNLKAGSKLQQVLGIDRLKVNALHNQAVKDPGEGIEVVAREPNQVVQGIEHSGQDYLVGVQWHPEYLPHKKFHRRLFQALVAEAREVLQQIEEPDMEAALQAKPTPKIEAIEKQIQDEQQPEN